MSSYFKNFAQVDYQFGNEVSTAKIQNLTQSVRIEDIIQDDISFYSLYTILDGDRPDILSYKFYDNVKYHYTFYLMNSKILESGWPLVSTDVTQLVQTVHPNTTLVSQDILTGKMNVGQTVTGSSSGASGKIISKRYDFGQIIIEGTHSFSGSEVITSDTGETVTLTAATPEYLSTHHYVDGNGNYVDVDPFSGDPSIYTVVTFLDQYNNENDNLKQIRIIKPSAINQVHTEFMRLLKE